jgi:hypothetical protein
VPHSMIYPIGSLGNKNLLLSNPLHALIAIPRTSGQDLTPSYFGIQRDNYTSRVSQMVNAEGGG